MNLRVAVGSLALAGLVAGIGIGWGQETVSPSSGTVQPVTLTASEMPEILHLSDAQLEAFLNSLNATPTIPYTSLPRDGMVGTFMSLSHPGWPGLPADVSHNDVWPMDGFYLLNDVSNTVTATVASTGAGVEAQVASLPAPAGFFHLRCLRLSGGAYAP